MKDAHMKYAIMNDAHKAIPKLHIKVMSGRVNESIKASQTNKL